MCGCLQSVQEVQYSDEIAFGNELLKDIPQEQMQDRLHRHIVAIIWRRNGTVGRGSGLLISKNLILTSAHNFFLNRVQVDRKCFQIYISPCGTMSNPYEIQCVYTPPNYKTSPQAKSIEYDYALVKLQKKVDADDFICLKAFEESEMDNKNEMNIAIFGYQNGNYKSQSKSHIQQSVFQSGIIKKDCIDSIRVERSQVLHVVSTHNGQSGSPMIQIKEEALVVMGIHKGGATIKKGGVQKKLNTGRLITKELIQDLKNQANLIGGQMFPVYDKLNPLKLSKSESNKPNVKASQFFGKLEDQLQQQKMLNSRPEMVQNLSIEQLMKRGDELYNKSQFKRARQYYRKIIQLKPYNSKAYFNMGLTFEGESYFEGAILAHKRASKLDPKNQHAHYNLGYCYQKINNNKQARSSYQSCLKINAKHQNANQSLAKLK